ncbi:hypothetical protein [Pedobacter nutrimenti]|uniref:hypothetical protein n=1 Tax=Pedobacter nutrimenti TaxID=1241337 RepID=UPI00292CF5F0|nr:hypothetical protein [Pedobacter nutrimenti]
MQQLFWFCLAYLFAFLLCNQGQKCYAQEIPESISYAQKYLDNRSADLTTYLSRSGKIQQRLLKKLKHKEGKIARKLAAKDSTLYWQYMQQRLSYDSIARLSQDTSALNHLAAKKRGLVDSLKGVQNFIQKQSGKLGGATALVDKAGINTPYTAELNKLQQQLSGQQHIDDLIKQRTGNLEQLAVGQNISGLQSIQKNVYYAQEKMKAFKKLADDPDEAEEEALEYLQGTEGFSQYLNGNQDAFGGLSNNATAEDLQRMGYQTKSQVNAMLQQKLGNNLSAVQQQMAQQVQDYSEKLNEITGKVSEAKKGIAEAKQTINEAKQTKDKLKHIEKPAFQKNPERGKPVSQRLETQYNFQTSRAGTDELRPAMLELGASVAFKHTPRLSYGIGISLSTGLGRNWQNIRLTYEGVSARAFADWKALYGFSLQAGYERTFRPADRPYLPEHQNNPTPTQPPANNALKDAFGGQQQAAYVGIMKRYRINSKVSGTFLIGYNCLWQQEALRSPFLIRFGAIK